MFFLSFPTFSNTYIQEGLVILTTRVVKYHKNNFQISKTNPKRVMGILYIKTTKTMDTIGIMIRKKNYNDNGKVQNPTRKNLDKQFHTLHRKMKKSDKNLITNYVIEKDNHKGKFHSHLLIYFTDKNNLYNQLSRFIGGNIWKEREEGFNTVYGCYGMYGEVDTHNIYDEVGFINYMNKIEQSITLI